MSDRAQAIIVTPQACPFIALDGDRERRGPAPDPRHRCFAGAAPQPRSLAHQGAYCLSPTFTGCPIFLDWATRAAADPVAGAATSWQDHPFGPGLGPAGSASPQLWQAPPPWVIEPGTRSTAPGRDGAGFGAAGGAGGAGGSAVAPGMAPAVPVPPAVPLSQAAAIPVTPSAMPLPASQPIPVGPPPLDMSPQAAPRGDEITGNGRTHAQAAGGSILAPPAPPPAPPVRYDAPHEAPPLRYDAAALAARSRQAEIEATLSWRASVGMDGPDGAADGEAADDPDARATQLPVDVGAPSRIRRQTRPAPARASGSGEWDRGKRFEAHPAIGPRFADKRVPAIAVGIFVLAAVVVLLLVLPGLLAGDAGGNKAAVPPTESQQASAPASAAPSRKPRASTQPTPVPVSTPRSYTVKTGDTLIGLAVRFRLTKAQLQCANGLKNPDLLPVGATLIIPPQDYRCPRKGSRSPAPSQVPRASP